MNLDVGKLRYDRPHLLPTWPVWVAASTTSTLDTGLGLHIAWASLPTTRQLARCRCCITTTTSLPLWFWFRLRFRFFNEFLRRWRYSFWLNGNTFIRTLHIGRLPLDGYFCTITIGIHY